MNQPINISLELLISGGGDTDLTHPRVIFTMDLYVLILQRHHL